MRTGRNEYAAVKPSPPATISGAGQCSNRLAPSATTAATLATMIISTRVPVPATSGRRVSVGRFTRSMRSSARSLTATANSKRRDDGDEHLREERAVVGAAGLRETHGREHPDEDQHRGPGEDDDQTNTAHREPHLFDPN